VFEAIAMPIVVAFISQKGGVGKSTLARALAAVAAHGGLKVSLADLDPKQGTLLQWQAARKQSKVSPRITVSAFENVDAALAAGERCDLVILDTPGRVDVSTLAIAKCAHLIVQPTGPSVDDLHPTVLVFHELAQAGIPRSRLVAALCRVLLDDEEIAARSYLEEAGYEALAGSIPENASYRIAHNKGQSLTETAERSLNARADALMESLLTRIGSLAQRESEPRTTRKRGDAA
jgi:chromosome partitioning protein